MKIVEIRNWNPFVHQTYNLTDATEFDRFVERLSKADQHEISIWTSLIPGTHNSSSICLRMGCTRIDKLSIEGLESRKGRPWQE